MENKQSPGPWVVRHFESTTDNPWIEVTDAQGNAVASNEQFYPAALKPANARLIAAAPELLAALEQMVQWHGLRMPDCDTLAVDHMQPVEVRDAMKAIAKATGAPA